MLTIKRILLFLIIITFSSESESLDTKAKQAILFDYETNSIIFEKNSEELMSPSSMSKIMTIYYVFKKIKDGELKLSDKFKVSKKITCEILNVSQKISNFFVWPDLYNS